MKGTLLKRNDSWFVEYTTINGAPNLIEIHPEYVKYYFLDEDAEDGEVEFEISHDFHYGTNDDGVYSKINKSYAKLIRQSRLIKLDLPKMEQKLDTALANETSESLEEWMLNKREIHNYKLGLDDGYNLAKKNLFTEAQVMKAMEFARTFSSAMKDEDFIKSLKQHKQ